MTRKMTPRLPCGPGTPALWGGTPELPCIRETQRDELIVA